MEPSVYIPAYLETRYLAAHPDLTPAARELLHQEVHSKPDQFVLDDHARVLLTYARTREDLLTELDRLEDTIDDDAEYERKRGELFASMRVTMRDIAAGDQLCVDARLVDILLADVPLDDCLNDLLKLENEVRGWLEANLSGFDIDAPHYWAADAIAEGEDIALRTASEPVLVGWLHIVAAISQGCLGTARYRAAAAYARQLLRGVGFEEDARDTLLLALARLEDEDGFFACAREAGDAIEDSPWYLLGRTLLLYKLGRRRNARRALRDFAGRCEGGAFFLLNPTYLVPYLPSRPTVHDAWKRTHQAVWEADAIIVDTPDFVTWASAVDGIDGASEHFADAHGF